MERGRLAKYPVSRPLGRGLFELRGDAGREHVRFIYFFQPGQRVIFVLASFKGQRTLPDSVIKRARAIRDTLIAEPELIDGVAEIH